MSLSLKFYFFNIETSLKKHLQKLLRRKTSSLVSVLDFQ